METSIVHIFQVLMEQLIIVELLNLSAVIILNLLELQELR